MVETNWREGSKGKHLKGYKIYWKCRKVNSKKGGGIAIFVKENIVSYKWERDEGLSEDINDTIWIVIKLENERKLAISLV